MRFAQKNVWLSLLVVLCAMLTPTGASAQVVESYQLRHYAVGATEPVQTDTFAASGACRHVFVAVCRAADVAISARLLIVFHFMLHYFTLPPDLRPTPVFMLRSEVIIL